MRDAQYFQTQPPTATRPHAYGPGVTLYADPTVLTQVARLCTPECVQPEANRLFRDIYRDLGREVANQFFPKRAQRIATRMAAQHHEGYFEGQLIDPDTRVVIISLARAGIVPSLALFELYSEILDPKNVRVDHVMINRATDAQDHVTGASIYGSKIGGPVHDAIVIIPDPMGATGSSLSSVLTAYEKTIKGTPRAWISLNLVITPEFVRRLQSDHPSCALVSVRLDRGFSSERALAALPGQYPDEERGLNEKSYIVPGGGGLGELSSNSWV